MYVLIIRTDMSLAFFLLLFTKVCFRSSYINFLIVGHTQGDINTLFGRWSWRLKANDYPMLPMLMKSCMDTKNQPIMPHWLRRFLISQHLWMGTFIVAMPHYKAIQMHNSSSSTKMVTDGQWCNTSCGASRVIGCQRRMGVFSCGKILQMVIQRYRVVLQFR
jgi:hypothetical protein